MATWILLRSVRSALKSQDLTTRCLASTAAVTCLNQRPGSVARLLRFVTDDIVNSEAKLHALFLKWLSYNDHHFDIEDEKAFKERFELFKKTARVVNEWNKSGNSSTLGLNDRSDLTREESANRSWKIFPKKKLPF
ncbi:hypothetical protein MKW94_027411 [Papaver nudicaule]|uniref:Cathepsin propeptide inhibitor domain-containing protein n=1 Tax=Papaver nudicaule TaxID=74823 RepID=A0AA41VU79_PAPNU|nr:hypothetical protein [Papaver nudicaule]